MVEYVNQGRDAECWRSRLLWLYNDGDKESFRNLVELVQRYLREAKILPPRLTHEQPPKVLVEFEEEGITFDISTSGGGLRTLLNLAAVLHFSRTGCILCDEPDSHLHGSLQAAIARMLYDHSVETNRQVFVATHAADFIAQIPLENVVWIDRKESEGRSCGNLGRVLADLGSVSKADAVRAWGADKVLFVEGSLDKTVLSYMFGLVGATNPFADPAVLVAALPSGKGDRVHLCAHRKFVRETCQVEVAIACLTDNDYELDTHGGHAAENTEGVLLLSLPGKETENFFLEPDVLATALAATARRRKEFTGAEVTLPPRNEIVEKLMATLEDEDTREYVRWQLVPRYRDSLEQGLDPSTRESRADKWFDEHWGDEKWRLRNCPGKAVLKKLRDWCQREYGLTLTAKALLEAVTEPPPGIAEVAQRLQAFFYGGK